VKPQGPGCVEIMKVGNVQNRLHSNIVLVTSVGNPVLQNRDSSAWLFGGQSTSITFYTYPMALTKK